MSRRDYGEGSVYKRASDGRWVGTIEAGYTKSGSRRRITVTGKTKTEAKNKLRDKRRDLAEKGAPTITQRTTVKAWSEQWLQVGHHKDRPKTHTTDRGAVSAWIVPTIGHKRLSSLTPADVRSVSNAVRDAGLSSSTARRYDGVLRRMLKAAVLEGHQIAPNVLATERPEEAVNDRQALTVTEALAVLQIAATLPHGSRWAVALLQGMRKGECLGLLWENVDLDTGWVAVSWQLQALPYLDPKDKSRGFRIPDKYEARQLQAAYHLVRPKSKKGWRVIPLVPWAREALRAWREIAPESPHGLVWPALDGGPADPREDSREWDALQSTAGVGHPAGRYYTVHETRNTTATLLMEAKVSEAAIIAILGHSSFVTSMGYMHADQTHTLEALGKVAERLQLS